MTGRLQPGMPAVLSVVGEWNWRLAVVMGSCGGLLWRAVNGSALPHFTMADVTHYMLPHAVSCTTCHHMLPHAVPCAMQAATCMCLLSTARWHALWHGALEMTPYLPPTSHVWASLPIREPCSGSNTVLSRYEVLYRHKEWHAA